MSSRNFRFASDKALNVESLKECILAARRGWDSAVITRTRVVVLVISLLCVMIAAILLPNASAYADMPAQKTKAKTPIQHIVVLMQENHTFDNYFGTYPGADGIKPGTCMPVNPQDKTNTG